MGNMSQDSLFPHLEGVPPAPQFTTLAEQAAAAEAWETPQWAARAILDVEIMTQDVVDPCCGAGILSEAAKRACYRVHSTDLYDWGYEDAVETGLDFLTWDTPLDDCTVFMNPPFSLACRFVDQARHFNARKIVCFQRQAWRESQERRWWWETNPPARIWLCGDRAVPYLLHLSPEERKEMNGMQTAHAWYVWEKGHRGAELQNAIWKMGAPK